MTEKYQVPCVYQTKIKNHITVEVPGSKSITNRALLLATLANGKSTLQGTLFSDDSRHFLKCIQELGFETKVDEKNKIIEVTGLGGKVPKKEASIYVGSAGTAARFLSAYLGVSHGTYQLDASDQMRKRPMAPLLACLKDLGCEIYCHEQDGYFPFTLNSCGFGKNEITVDIGTSSQFLSGLLITSNLSDKDVKIHMEGTHGMSYIRMTEKMMEQFGVKTSLSENNCYITKAGQNYSSMEYRIEPDVSAACYFYAMAVLLGLEVTVKHVHFDSLQGDVEFLRILEKMGCRVEDTLEGIKVSGNPEGRFLGIEVDMSACSDQAITLAAIAPFADGPTRITGIRHIRFQESDRIKAIVTELEKMGITCIEEPDAITIYPGKPRPSQVETYEDHRMAMGFSLIGLRTEGIEILNPECCKKTFENYFQVLEKVTKEICGIPCFLL